MRGELVAMIAIGVFVGAVLIVSGLLALCLYGVRHEPVPEPYHPLFAGLDCGCHESPVVVGCMVCNRTSCPIHQAHGHTDPGVRQYEENGDTFGWRRSKYFTGEEAVELEATAQAPAIVPMSSAEANLRLKLMVDADDSLRDLRELPYDLAPLYVAPEEKR